MPMYEYRCINCGAVHEEYRRIIDRDKLCSCEVCIQTNSFSTCMCVFVPSLSASRPDHTVRSD